MVADDVVRPSLVVVVSPFVMGEIVDSIGSVVLVDGTAVIDVESVKSVIGIFVVDVSGLNS